jgi:hypothetical protein
MLVKEKKILSSVKIGGEKQYHMHPKRAAEGCFNLN